MIPWRIQEPYGNHGYILPWGTTLLIKNKTTTVDTPHLLILDNTYESKKTEGEMSQHNLFRSMYRSLFQILMVIKVHELYWLTLFLYTDRNIYSANSGFDICTCLQGHCLLLDAIYESKKVKVNWVNIICLDVYTGHCLNSDGYYGHE